MAHSTALTVQIDRELEREVDQTFRHLGLSASQAILLFFQQVQEQRGLPFSRQTPNATTRQALHDAQTRQNLTTSASSTALFADLGIAQR